MSFPPRMASYPAFPVRVTNEEYSPPTPNRLRTPFLRRGFRHRQPSSVVASTTRNWFCFA
jgi:hypothetical protein